MRNLPIFLCAGIFCFLPASVSTLFSKVPEVLTYQGRILVDEEPFSGQGQLKFALVDGGTDLTAAAQASAVVNSGFLTEINVDNPGNGYTDVPSVSIEDESGTGATAVATIENGQVSSITIGNAGSGYSATPVVTVQAPPSVLSYVTYWSNDGTSADGSEPAAAVSVVVTDGLFTVALGDSSLTNMNALPNGVFDNDGVYLRIWFNDGVNGFAQLTGDQPLNSTAFALRAEHAERAQLAETVKTVNWRAIADLPEGFGDGVDNDTLYSAGTGLTLDLGEFSISDLGVDTDQLATNSVTNAKLANGAVGADELGENSVSTFHIVAGSIQGSDLASNIINSGKIADFSILDVDLSSNLISSNHIVDNSIEKDDLDSSVGVWDAEGDWQFWQGSNGEGNGRVGINTASVSYALTVRGDGVNNVAARFDNDFAPGNIIYSVFAAASAPDDSKNWNLRAIEGIVNNADAEIGYGVRGIAQNASNTNYGVYGAAFGGTTNYAIYGSGDMFATGSYLPSDQKLKRNIETFNAGLDKVMALRPITSEYKTDEYAFMNLPEGTRYGFVAQEVGELMPQLTKRTYQEVHESHEQYGEVEGVEFSAVNYTEMIPVLVSAIQEQQDLIEALQLEVQYLKLKVDGGGVNGFSDVGDPAVAAVDQSLENNDTL